METFKLKETTFTSCAGRKITIRETNGEDEAILSKMATGSDNKVIAKYLVNIITDVDGKGPVDLANLITWKNREIYHTLLQSRIHSLGEEAEFSFVCTNPNCTLHKIKKATDYIEQLNHFTWDFSTPSPTEGELNYFPQRVKAYPIPTPEYHQFATSSGRVYRFKHKTYANELEGLEIPAGHLDLNLALSLRSLAMQVGPGSWQELKNFKATSSREMSELRKEIFREDPEWQPTSTAVCPSCATQHDLQIFSQPAFFFPGITL